MEAGVTPRHCKEATAHAPNYLSAHTRYAPLATFPTQPMLSGYHCAVLLLPVSKVPPVSAQLTVDIGRVDGLAAAVSLTLKQQLNPPEGKV